MGKMNNEEQEVDAIELETETLSGDVRDAILNKFRNQQKPWQQMTEAEQSMFNNSIDSTARYLVTQAVKLVAAEGRKTIAAVVDSITVKDGIKATVTLPKSDEQRHNLIDSQGQTVLIVVVDTEKFNGEKEPAPVDPDQPELGNFNDDEPIFDKGKLAEETKGRGKKKAA
jgi:hypothetical protein